MSADVPGGVPLPGGPAGRLEVVRMASTQQTRDRVLGIWGPGAYTWSGEERQRAAGFPLDPSGRQRVLGIPADSPGLVDWDRLRSLGHPIRRHKERGMDAQRSR
jgi:hypothetical protein